MAELVLTIRQSATWPEAFEAVTSSGRILAVGRDISRQIVMRANEEFPHDTALAVVYSMPVESVRDMRGVRRR
jgi:hypothetical protein